MKNRVLRVFVVLVFAAQNLFADGDVRRRGAARRERGTGMATDDFPSFRDFDAASIVPSMPRAVDGTPRARVLAALSPAHGTVRRVMEPPRRSNGPLFVHLQDVHGNADAQTNLARALEALTRHGGANVVGLEGGWGALPVGAYQRFPDRAAVRSAAEYLLREGKISGPVFAGITGRGDYFGLEDEAAYHRNVAAYRAARTALKDARAAVDEARRELARGKDRLNPALRGWVDAVEAHEEGRRGLGAHTDRLASLLPGSDLPDGVRRFRRVWAAEKSIDTVRVERERAALMEQLVRRLDARAVDGLRRGALAHRAGEVPAGEFYRYLQGLCRAAGVPWSEFPALAGYADYVRRADQISVEELLRDFARAEKAVVGRWAVSTGEARWVAEHRRWRLARKLVDFALPPAEWAEWRKDAFRWAALGPLEIFYTAADARDGTLAANALALAARVPPGEPVVIVTGGYHGEGLARRLTEAGATVIQWTPKISRVETGGGAAYLSAFAQEKTPLETMMQGEKLFLAPPVADGLRTEGPWAVAAAHRLNREPFPLTDGERRLLEGFLGGGRARPLRIVDARVEDLPDRGADETARRVVFTVRDPGLLEIVVYVRSKTGLLRMALRDSRGWRLRRGVLRWARRAARFFKSSGPSGERPALRPGRRRFFVGALALVLQGAAEKARAVLPGFWLELARTRARPHAGTDKALAAESFFKAWRVHAAAPAGPARADTRREVLARSAAVSPEFAKTVDRLVALAENPDDATVDPRDLRDALNAELLAEGLLAEVEWRRGPGGAPVLTLASSRILEVDHFAIDGKAHVSYLARGDGTIEAREAGYSTHEGVIVVRAEAVEHNVMISFWPQFDSLLRERSPSLLAELRNVLNFDEVAFFLRHARFVALRAHFMEEFRRLGKPFADTPGALRANLPPDWQIELRDYLETRRALGENNPDFLAVKGKLTRAFARAVRVHELAHERALPSDGEPIAYINEILVSPLSVFGAVRMALRARGEEMDGLTPAEARTILALVGRALELPAGATRDDDFHRALSRIDFPSFLRRLEEEYRREFQRAPAVRADHVDAARRLPGPGAVPVPPGRATSALGVALAEAAGARFGVPAPRSGAFYKAIAPLAGTLGALAAVAAASALPVAPSVVGAVAPLTGALYGAVFAFAHAPRALRLFGLKPPVTDPETSVKKTAAMALLYAAAVTLTLISGTEIGGGALAIRFPGAVVGGMWAAVLALHGVFDGWGRRAPPPAPSAPPEDTTADAARDLLPPVVLLGLDTVDRVTRFRAIADRVGAPAPAAALAERLKRETSTPARALLVGFLLGRPAERNAPEKPLALVALVAEKDVDDRLRADLEAAARDVESARLRSGRDVRLIVTPENARAAAVLREWALDRTPGVAIAEPVAAGGTMSVAALGGAVRRWGPPADDAAVLLSCTAGFAPLIPRDALWDDLPDGVALALRVLIESLAARPLAPVDFSTLLRAAEKIDQSA